MNAAEFSLLYGSPMAVLSSCLRGFLRAAPGKILIAADYIAIEARGVAWLAGQEDVLDVFRSGQDIYLHAATKIYGREITKADKPERQIGKVATLALGYQGGVGAFQTMARAYGIKVADADADRIKVAWREAHPKIVQYWYDLEQAALDAVRQPGKITVAGAVGREIRFLKKGSFLLARLPSGRRLAYPFPVITEKEVPWGGTRPSLTYKTVDSTTRQWGQTDTYGGKLCENVTQAICRDLLAAAIVRLEKAGFPVVLHVHDEIVCEVDADDESAEARMSAIMSEVPPWAAGFPIEVESWRAVRYRK